MKRLSDVAALLSLVLIAGCNPTQNSKTQSSPRDADGSVAGGSTSGGSTNSGLVFSIHADSNVLETISSLGLETPVSGRLFVILTNDDESEPRQQIGVSGVPFWGMNVNDVEADKEFVLSTSDASVRGFPYQDIGSIPAGEYTIQPFLSVYTTFHRSDGNTLSMHLNSGAGQHQFRAPGNAYGSPIKIKIDPKGTSTVSLSLDHVIEPSAPLISGEVLQQGNPVDTDRVKFVKIKSDVLSDFWGHDMYIGANVLLPDGYGNQTDRYYPTIYMQGHFPGNRAPLSFADGQAGRGRSEGFSSFWISNSAPRMIAVSIRDANPFYDTSYSVNSANVGPYGDAIMTELLPYLEKNFRMVPEEWARVLAGGSTGGWEAIAMQAFYPDSFGGSWGWCPDPVDFNYYQIVNVYEDDNAYTTGNTWHKVERPNARRPDGNVRSTVRQENYLELASGSNGRSGGQWAIWEAVFGPVGDNGYPRRIWDPVTGHIDHETAAYWQKNYDIHQYLSRNWESVAPRLQGKFHVAVGDMDSYYLDDAVYILDDFFKTATSPKIDASVEYGRREPHCWTGYSPDRPGENLSNIEFVQTVARYLTESAPASADRTWLTP